MAKDYLSDMLSQPKGPARTPARISDRKDPPPPSSAYAGERTIRNIAVPPRREQSDAGRMRQSFVAPGPAEKKNGPQRRVWPWVAVALVILALLITVFLSLRDTTVKVTPASRAVTFDNTSYFTAYPEGVAAGALSYGINTIDIEDSAVVPSSGMEQVSERASGIITIYNDYSNTTVKLLKNTRFVTPDGLIFRVPAAVVIPGKQGILAGSIAVTVIADEAGEKYNIGPVSRFTLPGLKSSPDMYTRVYARSEIAMNGGFVGTRPSVAPGTLETARAEVRGRLESKMRDSALFLASSTAVIFPDLMRVTYISQTSTVEAGGGVRIHEKAHAEIPIFSSRSFAATVAKIAGANTEDATVVPSEDAGLTATPYGAASTTALGKDPIEFTLSGKAQLISNVDTNALAAALAGQDQSAFQAIIKGFPSILEARAWIEPFWKGAFPQDVSDIRIEVEAVTN